MPNELDLYRGQDGISLARSTVEELAQRSIPASPANYELWIAHKSGAQPDLSREIQARLDRGERFTDEINAELFERFISQNRFSARIVEASAGLARELAGVVSSLRDAGALAGDYAGELQAAAAGMERSADPETFCAIVNRVAAATRDMAQHNLALEERMAVSSRQVETLQAALEDVRTEALTDGLTGLANRRCFDQTLRALVEEEQRSQRGLCLLLCDIDHFKRVNDSWGHQVGDQVIRYVASVLRSFAREDQLPARYGGEEFAIVMPRANRAMAGVIAERIRAAIKAKALTRRSTKEMLGAVTMSLGVAMHRPGESAASLLSRADACLYHSKRTGRDRTTLDSELEASSAA